MNDVDELNRMAFELGTKLTHLETELRLFRDELAATLAVAAELADALATPEAEA